MVKKYRNKPVEVEAIQFTGDNWKEIILWLGEMHNREENGHLNCDPKFVSYICVETTQGLATISLSTYIVKSFGKVRAFSEELFANTYEEIL